MQRAKVIIMLGGPASGKGTQAKILAKRIGYAYFGTGDLLRAEVEKGSEQGVKFAQLMAKGELIPDELTDPIVKSRLSELTGSGIVIDGYPRNLDQVETLRQIFPDEDFLVLNIIVSAESLLKRMSSRRICDSCGAIYTITDDSENNCSTCGGKLIQRADDKPEVLSKRIRTYEDRTKPIIDYYRQKDKVVDIDGEPPIPAVTEEIKKII